MLTYSVHSNYARESERSRCLPRVKPKFHGIIRISEDFRKRLATKKCYLFLPVSECELGNLPAVFLQPDASEIEFHVNRVSVSQDPS